MMCNWNKIKFKWFEVLNSIYVRNINIWIIDNVMYWFVVKKKWDNVFLLLD